MTSKTVFTSLLLLGSALTSQLGASCCYCCYGGSDSSNSSDTPRKLSKQEVAQLKEQGGVLYDVYGEAWHPIRYRTQYTAAQWKTILLQKRIRVPLTADDQTALMELFVGER